MALRYYEDDLNSVDVTFDSGVEKGYHASGRLVHDLCHR
jgi:hypothetical protein